MIDPTDLDDAIRDGISRLLVHALERKHPPDPVVLVVVDDDGTQMTVASRQDAIALLHNSNEAWAAERLSSPPSIPQAHWVVLTDAGGVRLISVVPVRHDLPAGEA